MKKLILLTITALVAIALHAQGNRDWAKLARYATPNAELCSQPGNGKRVVLLGNSITEFWVRDRAQFFEKTGYIGRGISGQTTYQMLVRFREDVINLKPRVVVINAGTNDVAENTGPYNEDITLGNIMSMCELARAHGIKVVLGSVLPCNKMYWSQATDVASKIESLNKRIRAYARAQKLTYIDYYTPMVEPVTRALDPRYTADGVHPNLAGYAVMEPLLVKAVSKWVK